MVTLIRHAAIILLVFVVNPRAIACPLLLPSTEIRIGETRLTLEIAAQPEARSCGLSRRDWLPANHGMLFVVPAPIVLDFWMGDTRLALSIAFLDKDGRILSIQDMRPDQPGDHYLSPSPARYAIEVKRGWFTAHALTIGDVVDVKLPTGLQVH